MVCISQTSVEGVITDLTEEVVSQLEEIFVEVLQELTKRITLITIITLLIPLTLLTGRAVRACHHGEVWYAQRPSGRCVPGRPEKGPGAIGTHQRDTPEGHQRDTPKIHHDLIRPRLRYITFTKQAEQEKQQLKLATAKCSKLIREISEELGDEEEAVEQVA